MIVFLYRQERPAHNERQEHQKARNTQRVPRAEHIRSTNRFGKPSQQSSKQSGEKEKEILKHFQLQHLTRSQERVISF